MYTYVHIRVSLFVLGVSTSLPCGVGRRNCQFTAIESHSVVLVNSKPGLLSVSKETALKGHVVHLTENWRGSAMWSCTQQVFNIYCLKLRCEASDSLGCLTKAQLFSPPPSIAPIFPLNSFWKLKPNLPLMWFFSFLFIFFSFNTTSCGHIIHSLSIRAWMVDLLNIGRQLGDNRFVGIRLACKDRRVP